MKHCSLFCLFYIGKLIFFFHSFINFNSFFSIGQNLIFGSLNIIMIFIIKTFSNTFPTCSQMYFILYSFVLIKVKFRSMRSTAFCKEISVLVFQLISQFLSYLYLFQLFFLDFLCSHIFISNNSFLLIFKVLEIFLNNLIPFFLGGIHFCSMINMENLC